MSCTERNNKIFTTPCLLVGPQRLVFLFAFCICIFNVTRHNWLDLENPQEAILYLFELKNLPLLCFSHWPQMHTSYPKTHSCVFEFVLCILHLYLCLFFLLTSCCVLLTSAHTHMCRRENVSLSCCWSPGYKVSRKFQICTFSTKNIKAIAVWCTCLYAAAEANIDSQDTQASMWAKRRTKKEKEEKIWRRKMYRR